MKKTTKIVTLLLVPFWGFAISVLAQEAQGGSPPHAGSAPAGGGGGGQAVSRDSGGGGGAGARSGGEGGGHASGSFSEGMRQDSGDRGDRHATTGGSGIAIMRGGERGSHSGASGALGGGEPQRAVPRGSVGGTDRGATTGAGDASGVPPHARPRNEDEPIVGRAVPRGSVPSNRDLGRTIISRGGYYPGFYDPWWYGGGYYGGGYYSGGYYGGYYDPWFGGYPGYGYPGYGYSPSYSSGFFDQGAVRLKVKPRKAEVLVDGYYVGIVDDYDGIFQRLRLESGAHRIDVRAEGYEPISFDVRIMPNETTIYRGELKKIR